MNKRITIASSPTRTGDPQLRRLLLYPAELWTQIGMSGFEPSLSCSQNGPCKGINRNHAMSSPECKPPVVNNQTDVRRSYRLPSCAQGTPSCFRVCTDWRTDISASSIDGPAVLHRRSGHGASACGQPRPRPILLRAVLQRKDCHARANWGLHGQNGRDESVPGGRCRSRKDNRRQAALR